MTTISKKSDCDDLLNNAENVFDDLGNCLESTFDEKKTKMNVLGSIFSLGKSLTKLAVNAGVCAVKNTPKVVVVVASAKREIVTAIEEEVH